ARRAGTALRAGLPAGRAGREPGSNPQRSIAERRIAEDTMRLLRYSPLIALAAVWLAPHAACATDTTAAPPAAPSAPSADSLSISANGSTLADARGDGGGSVTWLHDFTSGVLGVGGEYQRLADTHWAFGSLSGSVSTGSANDKWTFSADGHLGRGDTNTPV